MFRRAKVRYFSESAKQKGREHGLKLKLVAYAEVVHIGVVGTAVILKAVEEAEGVLLVEANVGAYVVSHFLDIPRIV